MKKLDPAQIKAFLKTKAALSIEVFDVITSTNDYLSSFCKENLIRVCIAEAQTKGKGQFQRTWHSPFGENIYLSLLYPFKKSSHELSGLTLIISLAVIKAIEKVMSSPVPLLMQWPNDIVCDNQKLGGILVELKGETSKACGAIIGIGLNVNMMRDEQSLISQPWTSLKKLSALDIDRNVLCANLIEQLLIYIGQFNQSGFAYFSKEWNSKDSLKNKIIHLTSAGQELKGIAQGIDTQGHLIVQLSDGTQRHFSSGNTIRIK